ncbi:MAG: M60 family metallopeptidase [Clostridium sp.]|nr:M60 family metallopeptidase [Clostridium sp.]MDU7084229.1 M60 family metallopeptidase [Clostridium sp.]
MNRRKISAMLAVALITSQVQSITFAETITKNQEVDSVNDAVFENVDDNNSDSVSNEITTTEDEEALEENTEAAEDVVTNEEVSQVQDEEENQVQDEEENQDQNEKVEEKLQGEEENTEKTANSEPYEVKGKLELDINFSTPIKVANANKTNLSVKLTSKDGKSETIKLGSDVTAGNLGDTGITYSLRALDSKRENLEENATELEFYHLTFENLQLGTYSIEIVGDGYEKVSIDDIEIQNSSKRILLGTTDKTIVLDDKGTENKDDDVKEHYPGSLLAGDVNSDGLVNNEDYEALKSEIKSKSYDAKFDLNRDGKVDITDLTYVHQNMNKAKKDVLIVDTDPILNPDKIEVGVDTEKVEVNGDIKDILKDTGSVVSLGHKDDVEISESNPIEIPINLAGTSRNVSNIEKVNIQAPSENAPSRGEIIIPGAGEDGKDLVQKFGEDNISRSATKTLDGQAMDTISIDLGKQVAVSQITIKVTGSRGNKNLAEIAKVEFLNNVYDEIPTPKMNVPVITNFTSSTAVGNEAMTIGWEHETNVTGYEIKVENLSNNSVSTYKTSEDSLRIEKVDAYGIYRISIQSIAGDWKSGYKDEQEGYDSSATGDTNLKNNSNDKDGVPDNVDSNYNPKAWDSNTGNLSESATGDNGSSFGKDSIIEVQVIPETAPEGPEGITVKGGYRQLTVSWKAHKKAKDYDLYYREVGTKNWIKAKDPNNDYVDSDLEDDIPTGVANISPEAKTDADELIRATSYTIKGLKDTTSYEIMMTATNHHGTGGLSQKYIGSTTILVPPVTTNYNLINSSNGTNELTQNIASVEFPTGTTTDEDAIVDNDYTTVWESNIWDARNGGPIVTFDKEYTIGSIKAIKRLDVDELTHDVKVTYYNEEVGEWKEVKANFNESNNGKVVNIILEEPIITKKIRVGMSVYPKVDWGDYRSIASVSEMKFYKHDSLEKDVDNLFADDLKLSLTENVTQEIIDELSNRAKTIDPINLEYHPNQEEILKNLQRAQDLLNDVSLNDKIITLDSTIHNLNPQNTIGQINNYQALGVAVKPGDKVNIYIGSPNRKDTKFDLVLTQFNAESGTAYKVIKELTIGKNEIEIPETGFDMNYEKGGNLYIGLKSGFADSNTFRVRVSGGTEIPHLNVNNIIDDLSKEAEVKESIRTYIRDLRSYVNSLPNRYPESASIEDNANNIYVYDPQTSILNATDIEGERVMLSLAADQVLNGIQSGLSGDEDAQVDRVYNTLLAWEQLMKVSYVQQGLLEEPIDFDGDGEIGTTALESLDGKSETKYYDENRAPKNRINIKYQRMFTGAFMYASSHHVGIGYGSIPGMMTGVPFKFDSEGNLINSSEGQLFGWGISHEVGHVHDRPGLTYAETTNNILALITQTFNDINESRIESSDAYKKVYDKVTSNSVGLASDGLTRLGMFWQLHLAYDNDYTYNMLDNNTDDNLENDTFYAKLYRETRLKGTATNEKGYDSTAQTFIMRASDAVRKDLRGFFEKWGLVASPKTNEYLDSKGYPEEKKAIYYLNDEARRLRLAAGSDMTSITMADDTKVNATFGIDENGNQISDRTYLNRKEVPLTLSVTKDADKILGYEIIRKEATSTGTKEVVVGFVERDKDGANGLTNYVDEIDAVNNRAFEYKVKAYDYSLKVTDETIIGSVKVNHDGSISKTSWVFDTNTRSNEDTSDENSGHGQVQDGSINKIKDNDPSTIYTASKTTDKDGNVVSGDPYVTIDLGDAKSVIGLKYNPGKAPTRKFSLKNLFNRSSETTYSPINKYEVYVSKDGNSWTKAHSGSFDPNKESTIYFNEAGSSLNTQLWAYGAQYVKLVAKGATSISIAELDILGPTGDNIEIGMDNGDKIYKNGIGRLKSDYTYADGQVIPEGSIIVTGEYKGDPAFNAPLVLNEKDEHFALESGVLLFAELPEDGKLGEVAEGTWLYWITPEQQAEEGNIEGEKIKAELYRYNKLEGTSPVGQRLVSDTFLYELPKNLNDLPLIELNNTNTRVLESSYDKVVEVNRDTIQEIFNNRK